MPKRTSQLDDVFRALAHPARRAVMQTLAQQPTRTSSLANGPAAMALPSLLEHLKLMEQAGLIVSEKQGRERIWQLRGEPIEEAAHWLKTQKSIWEARLDQHDAFVKTLAERESPEDADRTD